MSGSVPDPRLDQDHTMPFTGAKAGDLRTVVNFIIDVDVEYGMGVEVLDCILAEVDHADNDGGYLQKGIWRAICEWDL